MLLSLALLLQLSNTVGVPLLDLIVDLLEISMSLVVLQVFDILVSQIGRTFHPLLIYHFSVGLFEI